MNKTETKIIKQKDKTITIVKDGNNASKIIQTPQCLILKVLNN